MKLTRRQTLLVGLSGGLAYGCLEYGLILLADRTVSIGLVFALPLILGAIPVLLSTREQLSAYWRLLFVPWGICILLCTLAFTVNLEGVVCLLFVLIPFLVVSFLGMFLFRLYKLRWGRRTPLYVSLLLPLLVIAVEERVGPATSLGSVTTSVIIHAPRSLVWESIKNVRDIHPEEIPSHFVHVIGVPKPLDGRLDRDGVGGVRSITWEKGMHFREVMTAWHEGWGYDYDIDVDPTSIPPTTLDEHVVVGGEYFDVLDGGYRIDSIAPALCRVTLRCRYRVTTTFNFYCRWLADYLINDFNEVILEVIRKRCERPY